MRNVDTPRGVDQATEVDATMTIATTMTVRELATVEVEVIMGANAHAMRARHTEESTNNRGMMQKTKTEVCITCNY